MAEESIIDYKRLEVKKTDTADEDILRLLESTILGSEGGMRYSMQNIRERVISYGNGLSFMALYKKKDLIGVIGLCNRKTINCGQAYNATYLRYLAIRSAFQTARAAGRRTERMSHLEEYFKQKLFGVFSRPSQSSGGEETTGPHIMYAYVESRNERSKNLIHQAGYEYIRSFLTVAFSRFSPKVYRNVSKLLPSEEPVMAKMLADHYSGHCFYTDEFSFFNHGYYVLRKEGEIVAGVCAIPTMFRVTNVPGVWGWVMMKVMPYIPYFRRLFRPGEFRYLVLSSIYYRKDSEHLLPDLFESVCAAEGYNTALTWLDDHSDLFQILRTNRRMGALNRILNAKPGLVYASFSDIDPEAREMFFENPVYISGFDFS